MHGEQQLADALFRFGRKPTGDHLWRDAIRLRFFYNAGLVGKGRIFGLVEVPDEPVNRGAVYQTASHCHDGIIVAVSVNDLTKEGLRLLVHLGQPIGGHQPSGVGVGVGEGKRTSPEVFQAPE
jgi:hypothetical protein